MTTSWLLSTGLRQASAPNWESRAPPMPQDTEDHSPQGGDLAPMS